MANSQIKQVVQLLKKGKARRESGLFVVEGHKMVMEAPAARVEKVFASLSYMEKEECGRLLEEKGISTGKGNLEVVEDKIFRSLSETVTPQGVLCLVRQRTWKLEEILSCPDTPLLLLLEDLQDPGNLGTMVRTAEGAGVTGIVMNKGCVDLHNPKVIRSTMGSIYRLPVCIADSLESVLMECKRKGVQTFAAHLQGKNNYDQENYQKGCAFLIGNEGNGLTEEISRQADCLIKIPMEGRVESLNAAMAAGILMYEAAGQRRNR